MAPRKETQEQFDFFVPLVRDLALKDQRETMERPFFSLQKRKRLKPIEYNSPDGEVWVKVEAVPAYGMATIWDADILIWAASTLNAMKADRKNELPRELRTTAYELLKSIRRDVSGRAYEQLKAALDRLATTTIFTSIRAKRGRDRRFSWLDSWEMEIDPVTERPTNLKIVLSQWVYDGIVNEKSLLTLHQDYFLMGGGLERVLYRMARKHTGEQEAGWVCRISVLFEKSGSDCSSKEFNRSLRKIVESNDLPDYQMSFVVCADGSPAVKFMLRSVLERAQVRAELQQLDAQKGRGPDQAEPFSSRKVIATDD